YATGIEQLTNVKIELSDMSIAPNAISQVVGKSGLFEILLSVPEIKTSSEISLYLTGLSPEGLRLSSNKITVSYETNIQ
ncbi:MAG TPA: hypothetical protein VHW24_19265, partial [Bryobacteraceae bacterium]|nr:hypothetical protein [Bryobacteraceae bacterium]